MNTAPPLKKERDWWVVAGMTVTALSAAVSSFSGLRALASATGWPDALAWLLPLTVDAYAMTATRVWLSDWTGSDRARRFARWNAVMAIALSLVGNGIWHLVASAVLTVTWPIVILVGAVPPAILGLLSHLAVLRGQIDDGQPTCASPEQMLAGTADASTEPDPKPKEGAGLLSAAQAADASHRAEHNGKPITRDALRKTLRISTKRATELLHELRKEESSITSDE
ncbi:DUF2637 domain-containing protein [Streptomyces broussonetiae]|uniref:DUF2637 domain-containing protein n=1 Tax=Streptomyces broussonetiae TaxID=2686304 RepID=A0ABV5EJW3_9ACTN